MLELPADLAARLAAWSRAAGPEEACGVLVGAGTRVERVLCGRNVAPHRRTGFELDPADHLAACRDAREAGLDVLAYWHSHPHGPAVPSAADRAGAWPGQVQVIVGLGDDSEGGVETRAWRLDSGRFVELALRS